MKITQSLVWIASGTLLLSSQAFALVAAGSPAEIRQEIETETSPTWVHRDPSSSNAKRPGASETGGQKNGTTHDAS